MRACGVHTYADYRALLDRSPAEYERLRDALTINVTRFFRNAETWNLLRRDVLPDAAADPSRGEVRVWSAGCSSGEEAYTLAMLAAEQLERRRPLAASSAGSTVDATDIDRESLERARGGALPSRGACARCRPSWCSAYFEPAGTSARSCDRVRRAGPGAHRST